MAELPHSAQKDVWARSDQNAEYPYAAFSPGGRVAAASAAFDYRDTQKRRSRANAMSATAETPLLAEIPVLRITPPSRWWVLPFGELWAYRELLYFFVWRDIKIRYKQTAIGAAWAVLAAVSHDARLHSFLRQARAHSVWWAAVSDFLLQRLAALDVFRRRRCRTRRTRSSRISDSSRRYIFRGWRCLYRRFFPAWLISAFRF